MKRQFACAALLVALYPTISFADDISAERGRQVSIVGGCHDCHTEAYGTSGGQIDPAKAMMGDRVGFRGPWGTTYPANLRLRAAKLSEDGFTSYLQVLKTLPPMPWYNVRALPEPDIRSLYRYLKSLGEPGPAAPGYVSSNDEPKYPFVVLAPPQMPVCKRDFDCGVGEICSTGPVRACVKP